MTTKCSFYLCGKTKRKTYGIRTFFFPVKDENRCKQWVINSGNPELLLMSSEKLKGRFLCQSHFKKEYFLGRKLASSAVPTPYTRCQNIQKTYSIISIDKQGTSKSNFNEEILFLTSVNSGNHSANDIFVDISFIPTPSSSKRSLNPNLDNNTSPIELKRCLMNTIKKLHIAQKKLKQNRQRLKELNLLKQHLGH